LSAATIPVTDDLRTLAVAPDIIHGHHNHELFTALLRFPGVPAVRVCHGWLDERPQPFPRVRRYIAVDETTRDRCLYEWGIPEDRLEVLLNFVDLARFTPRADLPAAPARALVFSHNARDHLWAVKRACEPRGIRVDAVGHSLGNATTAPESLLRDYDLVFAKGRAAIEALATGCAVILCDSAGVGPMVSSADFERLRRLNFGIRALLEIALVEAAIAAGIIINTRIGVKNEWHRRWLDYRQLAERLRPMRSLKLLGLAAPDPPGSQTNPTPRRWIEWYATGIWRALGCPAGSIDGRRSAELARAVAAYEIAPQVAYHERHSHQIELLDRRLEMIAACLFWTTLIVSALVVIGLAIVPEWVMPFDPWFDLIGAGFPALGTAVFGIRFQGDFGGSAIRSQATANALRAIEAELRAGASLPRAADLTEQASRIMYGDLDEWRLINQQQDLDLV